MVKDFEKLFVKRELKDVIGINYKGLAILTIMLWVTIIALGHVFGGLEELNRRMVNPYTNWISIYKKGINKNLQFKFIDDFNNNDSIKENFHIRSLTTYNRNFIHLFSSNLKENTSYKYRTIDFENDPLFDAISQSGNVLFREETIEKCDLIITQKVLDDLGYQIAHGNKLRIAFRHTNLLDPSQSGLMFLNIGLVVEEVPSGVSILMSNSLSALLEKDPNFVKSGLSFYSLGDDLELDIKNLAGNNLVDVYKDRTISHLGGDITPIKVILSSRDESKDLIQKLLSKGHCLYYRSDCYESDLEPNKFYYSINLKDTEKVREFRDYSLKYYNVDVPLADVESKENFFLMSRLASLFIFLLVIFSLMSILLFLYSIITSHLNKVKSNLGTLKAFGLSNELVGKLYNTVFIRYFLFASLVSLVLSFIYFVVVKLVLNSNFVLFDYRIGLVWLLILTSLILFFKSTISKILFKSPGNLIYNR